MGAAMNSPVKQQLVISGVGGQGVLFVTRLLAEAAISMELPVLTSETHGMAQRGGTVISHFKVGEYFSPLIRPLQADGLLVLKAENLAQHGAYLKPGGWAAVNSPGDLKVESEIQAVCLDADAVAREIGNPKGVNLIMLGFALAVGEKSARADCRLFCSYADIKQVFADQFSGKKSLLQASLEALEAGYRGKRMPKI
jgi:indolepyruvate ferredoxin oxidoreductase beta subunit